MPYKITLSIFVKRFLKSLRGFLRLILLLNLLFSLGCSDSLSAFGTKTDASSFPARPCIPNELNENVCLVDKVGSFLYDSEYGGRSKLGKSILGIDGLSSISMPTGWYDGQTKVTFLESRLNSSNKDKIRLGKSILGTEGTLATPLPIVCTNEPDSNCMVAASPSNIFYAFDLQYGGRTSICDLNAAGKLLSDCWVDSVNTRVNSTNPINYIDCPSEGPVTAECTARVTKYWYNAVDGGRSDCSSSSSSLTGCWLKIPSGSVTLSSSASSGGVLDDCSDAREPGFNSSISCRTTSPGWYVYSQSYGGRSLECTADNAGNCFFKTGYDDVDPDLKPENIKLGIKIFDVLGTFEGEGVWPSAAHRNFDITQITLNSESVSYRDKSNLPAGYRSIPLIQADDEGMSGANDNGVVRLNWNSACGLTGTIAARITDCATTFDINAIWSGATKGNSGQGTWKLVTRAGNISDSGIYREVWRDERTGLLWSSVVSKSLNWCQAAGVHTTDSSNICNSASNQIQPGGSTKALSACYEGPTQTSIDPKIDILAKGETTSDPLSTRTRWRIPTIYDYEVADYNGIRFVMPDMSAAGSVEWTGTTRSTDLSKAWVYDSRSGLSDVRPRTDATIVVRCVGDRGYQ